MKTETGTWANGGPGQRCALFMELRPDGTFQVERLDAGMPIAEVIRVMREYADDLWKEAEAEL